MAKRESGVLESMLLRTIDFYRAYGSGEITAIKSFWSQSQEVSCIHPLSPMAYGQEQVWNLWTEVVTQHGKPIDISCDSARFVRRG
eukprot:CAMPEP_0198364096 /NCGR_PEP_ID=MMETSP1450-20131203/152070_1 /TAXON_ID=753684 ORGANISM="Madagascaria erythrocladiodes, Strain CCMP3234" /NCGR_SAMPLE_ID=MMETSP1450 /ASSEMBLY_ACC=CAM_ASM_001115 /LENGTH=85 /DNA_ID=CAMNT_0044071483 /DNA_START=36 /DNA_END=289 /DNA_ORIENTATION=-